MFISIDRFRHPLIASGWMDQETIASFLAGLSANNRPRNGAQLAHELVRHNRLTAYQIDEIYAGRGASLVLGNYVILDRLGQGGMGLLESLTKPYNWVRSGLVPPSRFLLQEIDPPACTVRC